MQEIKLGDEVKDIVTGFKGIAICLATWINGCRRVVIQPQELREGKPIEGQSFDIEQIEVVKTKKVDLHKETLTGGPMPEVTRSSIPTR